MKKDRRIFGKVLIVLTILFFYLPIVYMVVFSFNSSKSLTSFEGFSMQWYVKMLESHDMMTSLYTTIIVAILATVISTFVGTITAIGLSKSRKAVRNLVSQINDFPIMNPEIVTAIGLMLLFITFSINKGFMTLLLAHIAFCIPYLLPVSHSRRAVCLAECRVYFAFCARKLTLRAYSCPSSPQAAPRRACRLCASRRAAPSR